MVSRVVWHRTTRLWNIVEAASRVDSQVRSAWESIPDGTAITCSIPSWDSEHLITYMKTGIKMHVVKDIPENSIHVRLVCSSTHMLSRLSSGAIALDAALADGRTTISGPAPTVMALLKATRLSLFYFLGTKRLERLFPDEARLPIPTLRRIRFFSYLLKPEGSRT